MMVAHCALAVPLMVVIEECTKSRMKKAALPKRVALSFVFVAVGYLCRQRLAVSPEGRGVRHQVGSGSSLRQQLRPCFLAR